MSEANRYCADGSKDLKVSAADPSCHMRCVVHDVELAAERAAREKAERETQEAVTTASKLLGISLCDGCLMGEAGKHLHLSDEDHERLDALDAAEADLKTERAMNAGLMARVKDFPFVRAVLKAKP